MTHDERRLQKAIVRYCRLKGWWTLKGNYEGKTSYMSGKNEQEMGYIAGSPDLVILKPDDTLFIECKRAAVYAISPRTGRQIVVKRAGVQSDEQKAFEQYCNDTGRKYYIVRTFDEFQSVLNNTYTAAVKPDGITDEAIAANTVRYQNATLNN
jgi:hypothetical protein